MKCDYCPKEAKYVWWVVQLCDTCKATLESERPRTIKQFEKWIKK